MKKQTIKDDLIYAISNQKDMQILLESYPKEVVDEMIAEILSPKAQQLFKEKRAEIEGEPCGTREKPFAHNLKTGDEVFTHGFPERKGIVEIYAKDDIPHVSQDYQVIIVKWKDGSRSCHYGHQLIKTKKAEDEVF